VFSIRAAKEADIPVILQLIRGLAEYEQLVEHVTTTDDDLRRTLFGRTRYAEVLMAEADSEVAGFALFFHNYSTFVGKPGIYLEDLFVRPKFRRHGIGRAFFRELARLVIERNCGRLEWAVLNWNEPAIAFYRKLGAVPMNDWTVQRISGEALAALAE
jgi:GNAT superfamily N-acetyltransferase